MARKLIEWQFFDVDAEPQWPEQPLADQRVDQEVNSNSQEASHPPQKTYYLYELIMGIALLYGIAGYLLWQQAAGRIAVIEHEIVALQDELSAYHQTGTDEGDPVAPKKSSSALTYQGETEHLHFVASRRTKALVQSVAPQIDAKYAQLHREFGLALSLYPQKLTIIVDPPTNENYPFSDEQALVTPYPKFAAARYGMSEGDALTTDLFARLAHHLLERAVASRAIKPQWQGMTLALKTYIQLESGFHHNWQEEEIFLTYRSNAQSRPLDLVHDMIVRYEPDVEREPSPQASPTAYETANPLIEFILVTYGYVKIPELLDAFAEHDSWETLAPELFHRSADEFEE